MGLTERLKTLFASAEERTQNQISFDQYIQLLNSFQFNGVTYTYGDAKQEQIGGEFVGLARHAYKSNGVVFACMSVRQLLFEEARFLWRQRRNGRPGNLFGDKTLGPLEKPWPGATTRDLLGQVIQYADLGGNAFIARIGQQLRVLRPDWVKIIGGVPGDSDASMWDPRSDVLGYVYTPGGPGSGEDPITFLADEVAHFAPYPDPEAVWRGMSWLTPVIREVMADKAATEHKLMFFENAATPQLAVKLPVPNLEEMQKWISMFRENHEGTVNAYKTLYLGEGADVTVVGADLKQLDFKAVQGAGETRIAAAARVPPVIVGLSEGLQGSSLNEGNYAMARRHLGDGCIRPLWGKFAGCIQQILDQPASGVNTNAEVWYDDREVAFLREDLQDEANIQVLNSQALSALVTAGYDADSAVAFLQTNDLAELVHTGLTSVQLLPPGTEKTPAAKADTPPQENSAPRLELVRAEPAQQLQIHIHDERSTPAAPNVNVEFGERSFVAESPKVDVTVEAGEAPKVEFAERAIVVEAAPTPDVNVTVEAGEPPRVDFGERSIVVEAAPAPNIDVTVEPTTIEARLEIDAEKLRQEAPVINVNPTPVTVENVVNVPETPVNVNLVDEPRDAEISFKRGRNGQIESAKLTESDNGD